MTFFDELSSLCAKEMAIARLNEDLQRQGDLISGLCTMLGRTIARCAKGDPKTIETLATGCEAQVIEEASGMAGIINLAKIKRG